MLFCNPTGLKRLRRPSILLISREGESDTDEDEASTENVEKKVEEENTEEESPENIEKKLGEVKEEMLDSYERIRYAVRIYNMVILRDSFDRLIKQLDKYLEFRKLKKEILPDLRSSKHVYSITYAVYVLYYSKQQVPDVFLQCLVFMEDFLTKPKKNMSSKEEEALSSIEEKFIEYKKRYSDLILKFRERSSTDSDLEDSDFECVESDKDDQAEHWVTGEAETQWETVEKELEDILVLRRKSNFERTRQLTLLSKMAVTPAQKIEILTRVIRSQFHKKLGHIPDNAWKKCMHHMLEILDILKQNPNIVMRRYHQVRPGVNETKKGAGYKGKIRILENLNSLVVRIYFELDARFSFIQPDTKEYLERLRKEAMLFVLLQNVLGYYQLKKDSGAVADTALLLMDLIYEKPQYIYDTMSKLAGQADLWEIEDKDHQEINEYRGSSPLAVAPKAVPVQPSFSKDFREFMDHLVVLIKENGDESSKAYAVLRDVYHRTIMDEFPKAKCLLLESHFREEVQDMDRSTKILLDRVVAQLGLCAFRNGLIEEAHYFLSQLYASGSVEQLLARGLSQSHFHEDTSVQTIIEFLEVVYLICGMLVEDPNTGVGVPDAKGKSCAMSESQSLSRIMVASRALGEGRYQKSFKIIKSLDIWKCLKSRAKVLGMLKTNMKEKALWSNQRRQLPCGSCDLCRGILAGSSCGGS
ncbi:Ulp1 peptidase [Ranunculus cassubicifolius]